MTLRERIAAIKWGERGLLHMVAGKDRAFIARALAAYATECERHVPSEEDGCCTWCGRPSPCPTVRDSEAVQR